MNENKKAQTIIRQLSENGWDAYIVGGAVRDIVLEKTPSDIDVVTNAPYETIKKLFRGKKLSLVGVSYKVCIVDGIEVSTFRRDTCFDPLKADSKLKEASSLKEDLARRDFTMNALAFCPDRNEIIDEFGGVQDIKNRIIRFTGDPEKRIAEDPCRMVRAARFVAQLNGTLDQDSRKAIITQAARMKQVAPERIRLEMLKAMGAEQPSLFFDALHDLKLLRDILPDFHALYGHDGGPYHAETLDTHVKLVGDGLPENDPLLRLAGYLHDIGKPAAAFMNEGHLSFLEHDRMGMRIAQKELIRLKFSIKEVRYIAGLIRHHMRSLTPQEKPKSIRRTLKALREDQIPWKAWFLLRLADKRGNLKKEPPSRLEIKKMVLKIYREAHPKKLPAAFSIKDLAVTGKDVMTHLRVSQGPLVGRLLKSALDVVLDDPSQNTREILMAHIKKEFEK